jgi:prepilin-type N-terminal cleavage/methylation domain-containing protein
MDQRQRQQAHAADGGETMETGQRGFTLIEVVVAVAVLIAVLSGVAGVWVMAATSTRMAREQTLEMQLARDKLEQLTSLTWSVRSVSGGDVLESDITTNISRRPATSDGLGTQPSPGDSLATSRATYADYLDARGTWLAAGPSPPAGARFVRRWWLARTGAGSSEMLLFQVIVATVAADQANPPGAWWRNHRSTVWLCGAKVRRRVAS